MGHIGMVGHRPPPPPQDVPTPEGWNTPSVMQPPNMTDPVCLARLSTVLGRTPRPKGIPDLINSALVFRTVEIVAVSVALMLTHSTMNALIPMGAHPLHRPLRRLLGVGRSGREIGINSVSPMAAPRWLLVPDMCSITLAPPTATSRAGSCHGCGHPRGYIHRPMSTAARATSPRTMGPRDADINKPSTAMPRPVAQWQERARSQLQLHRTHRHHLQSLRPRRPLGQAHHLRPPLRRRRAPSRKSSPPWRWSPTARGVKQLEGVAPRLGRTSLVPCEMLQFEGPQTGLGRGSTTVTDSAQPSGSLTSATGT